MKFIFSLILVIFLLSNTVFAKVEINKRIGINLSSFNTENSYKKCSYLIGSISGIYVKYHLISNLFFQFELLYSQKGGSLTYNSVESLTGIKTMQKLSSNLNYFDLPILLNYKVNSTSFYFGPIFSVLISAKGSVENASNSLKQIVAINDYYENFDYGFVVGINYELSIFSIDLRYNIGLANVQKITNSNQPIPLISNFTQQNYNNTLNFSLGFNL